jgi:hypothetical protein
MQNIDLIKIHEDIKIRFGLITPEQAKRNALKRSIMAGELTLDEAYQAHREALKSSFRPSAEIVIDEKALSTAIEAAIESALLDLKL